MPRLTATQVAVLQRINSKAAFLNFAHRVLGGDSNV